jgi:hypothetical protein
MALNSLVPQALSGHSSSQLLFSRFIGDFLDCLIPWSIDVAAVSHSLKTAHASQLYDANCIPKRYEFSSCSRTALKG